MLNIVLSAATKYTLLSYTITYSMLIVVESSAVMLIAAMQSVVVSCCSHCHFAECHYAGISDKTFLGLSQWQTGAS